MTRRALKRVVVFVLVLATLWALWEGYKWLWAATGWTRPFASSEITMPHLHDIVLQLREPTSTGDDLWLYLLRAALFTAKSAVAGFAFGAVVGFLLGAAVADPQRYGLDVIMPVFFTVLLVPMWRGAREAAPWAVAGIVALIAAWYLPGAWYLIIGTVAGMVAAGLQHERA